MNILLVLLSSRRAVQAHHILHSVNKSHSKKSNRKRDAKDLDMALLSYLQESTNMDAILVTEKSGCRGGFVIFIFSICVATPSLLINA